MWLLVHITDIPPTSASAYESVFGYHVRMRDRIPLRDADQ
jgi:hypothetical protein